VRKPVVRIIPMESEEAEKEEEKDRIDERHQLVEFYSDSNQHENG